LALLDEEGRLKVWTAATYYLPTNHVNNRGEPVTSYKQVAALAPARYKLDEVRVYDTKGGAVDPKDLPKLLRGETLVLVSPDGRPVDPLHLRLVKDGTLLFVVPMPTPVPSAPPKPREAPSPLEAPRVPPPAGVPETVAPPSRR
jgi:hypothetical protein